MKSPALLLPAALLFASGIGIGWVWRGSRDDALENSTAAGRAAEHRGASGKNGKAGSRTGGAGPAGASSAEGSAAESTTGSEAKRLLTTMLNAPASGGGPPAELFEFLQALAGCDAAELREMLAQVRDPAAQKQSRAPQELGMMILARLAGVDPDAAIDGLLALKKDGGGMDGNILRFMFSAIAKKDSAKIPGLIARMPDDDSRWTAQMAWLSVKAAQDPTGALADLAALPRRSGAGSRELQSVLRAAAIAAPQQAIETARNLGGEEAQAGFVRDVIGSWLDRDPNAAATWALENKDPAGLAICLAKAPGMVDENQLRRDFAALGPGSQDSRNQLAGMLSEKLADRDLNGALDWAASLPPAEQAAAQAAAGKVWVEKDPAAASEWLTNLPVGTARDQIAFELVKKISAEEPDSAFTWANSIKGPNRVSGLESALTALRAKDPAAADRAVQLLPDYDRAALKRLPGLRDWVP